MQSAAFFRLIAGPVGSAKTTTCIFELLRRAIEQEPCSDGLRHTRFAIVRQTLKQLKDTVLKDVLTWLNGVVSYKVSENVIYIEFGDVRSEWLLIPLDDPEDQRRLLSMQLTGAWLNECIEMSTEIVPAILGRCGRYPGSGLKPEGWSGYSWPTWFGAIADTNTPTEGDPWHTVMDVNTPPDWQIFIQPGGMHKDAENLENLPGGRLYYERLTRNNSPDWVQRYVHAQYGNDPSGSAVFKASFKKGFHSVKLRDEDKLAGRKTALEPVYGWPLIIAQDFGRTPCSLICQADHKGRALILKELVAEDIGLQMHIRTALKPTLLLPQFVGRPVFVIGDPAGRSKSNHFEETSFDLLKSEGLTAYPAPTNAIDKRLQAVDALLLQQRDGGPALLVDEEECPTLTLAMQGRYRFARRKNGQLAPLPEKTHPWSDLADCLQYFCLIMQGGMHEYIAQRINRAPQVINPGQPRQRVSARGWT
jgi:hypothetical protein